MNHQIFQVPEHKKISLQKDYDPALSPDNLDKEAADLKLKLGIESLSKLQNVLYAQNTYSVLIIFQAMDAAGKDSTIKHVMSGINPQGCQVYNFKTPTDEDLDHDYLWRIHQQAPAKGELVIFNRSHYEDVLVVRVHNIVPPEVWGRRFDQINAFEKHLAEEGTTILKFFLHITKEEQKQRLQARLDDPNKHWKFNTGDLKERALWDNYMLAYEDVLSKTSTPWAPWYVIPANKKWYRDLAISTILVDALKNLKMSYPSPLEDLSKVVLED